ncbi:MAG: hypothetical protein ACTIKE_12040 [Sphingobacterium sp.]
MKNLKSYVAAIVATASIAGFSAFNVADASNNLATETAYFHGDPTSPSEVEDASLWTTEPNGQSCNTGNDKACSMSLESEDLIDSPTEEGVKELDPDKIEIEAQATTSNNYVPTASSTSNPFTPQNRL